MAESNTESSSSYDSDEDISNLHITYNRRVPYRPKTTITSDNYFITPSLYCSNYTSPLFIGVAGIIGAGKTTLCGLLSKRLGYDISNEPVEGNPYLPLFYSDMNGYAYKMQMYMLGWRFKEHQRCVWSGKPYIQDRTIYEDVIFALMLHHQSRITKLDYDTYRSIFESMLHFLHRPDVIIYLDVTPDVARTRIISRGRECEKDISLSYLSDLHTYYEDWINSGVRGIPILKLNWNSPTPGSIDNIVHYINQLSRQATMPCVTYINSSISTVNQ